MFTRLVRESTPARRAMTARAALPVHPFSGQGDRIGHTMVVTKKVDGNVYLSYHTSDHLDEPFWGSGGIRDRNPGARYFGWKM